MGDISNTINTKNIFKNKNKQNPLSSRIKATKTSLPAEHFPRPRHHPKCSSFLASFQIGLSAAPGGGSPPRGPVAHCEAATVAHLSGVIFCIVTYADISTIRI